HAGIPVFGGEIIVHLDSAGSVLGFTDGLVPDVQADTSAGLAANDAENIALRTGRALSRVNPQQDGELMILRREGADYLTYRFQMQEMGGDRPSMPVVFVDAHTGRVVWSYDNLQTAKNRQVHNLNHSTTLPGPLVRSEGGALNGDSDVDTNYLRLGSTWD